MYMIYIIKLKLISAHNLLHKLFNSHTTFNQFQTKQYLLDIGFEIEVSKKVKANKSILYIRDIMYMYIYVQWSLTYPDYSLIWTHAWEPILIPQQKVTHLCGNSFIRTVSQGTELSV